MRLTKDGRPHLGDLRRAIKSALAVVPLQACLDEMRDEDLAAAARRVFPGDAKIKLVTREVVDLILAWSTVDQIPYAAEDDPNGIDCNGFAGLLRADFLRLFLTCCWEVRDYKGQHGYCLIFYVDRDGRVALLVIEPQTDGTVKIQEGSAYTGRQSYVWQ